MYSVPDFLPYLAESLPHLAESIECEIMDGFWHSRWLHNCMDLSDMIGTLASDANASLVAKNGTKKYPTTFDKIITNGQILVFEVGIWPYQSAQHDKIICK